MFTYDLCFDTSEILLPVVLPQVLHNCSPGIGTLEIILHSRNLPIKLFSFLTQYLVVSVYSPGSSVNLFLIFLFGSLQVSTVQCLKVTQKSLITMSFFPKDQLSYNHSLRVYLLTQKWKKKQ